MSAVRTYPVWTAAQAVAHIAETHGHLSGQDVYALRGDNFAPKARFRRSREWVDGRVTGARLPGVCAVKLATWLVNHASAGLPSVAAYGSRIFLIRGRLVSHGDDDFSNEVIVADHEIVAEIVDPPEAT